MKTDLSLPETQSRSTLDTILFCLSLATPLTVALAMFYPPPEITQGQAHRIFYLHVPVAWVALYAPILSALCGILFLVRGSFVYDVWSAAANRVAFLFALGVVISGPVWAKAIWGVYWDWSDQRLMTFFILMLSLGGYFYVRSLISSPQRRAVVSAVLSIVSALSAVITWFAIRLVEPAQHPGSLLGAMAPSIRLTFWLNVLSFHFLFLAFFRAALRHEKLKQYVETLL